MHNRAASHRSKPRGPRKQSANHGDRPRPLRARHAWLTLFTVIILALALPATARADSIKLSGFWHDNITIEAVIDGQLVYRTAGGRRTERSLAEVEGLKLDDHPALGEAEEAREAGEHERAATHYRQVLGDELDAWLASYVRRRLVPALDALGEAVEAVDVYTALIATDADAAVAVEPPIASIRRAAPAQQQQIAETLDAAMADADAAARPSLERMRAALDQDADADDAGADALESAVVLPAGIENDAATAALRAGDFQAALAAAERTLGSTGGLSMGLFQKARAQLALADEADDEALMKTAGLNFMRVIVYFPRSRYVGPALAEAGLVHARLGRADLAASLYDRARLRIDQEEDPAYYERLMHLREQLRADEHE